MSVAAWTLLSPYRDTTVHAVLRGWGGASKPQTPQDFSPEEGLQAFRAARPPSITAYRQGDLLLVRDDSAELAGQLAPRSDGLVVLAEGESSGHRHVIREPHVQLYASEIVDDDNSELLPRLEHLLDVSGIDWAALRHEDARGDRTGEHSTIVLPPGRYVVIHQLQWADQGRARAVID
jgi:hypothetical protein